VLAGGEKAANGAGTILKIAERCGAAALESWQSRLGVAGSLPLPRDSRAHRVLGTPNRG
jgi:hypothetical protein